MFLSTDGDEFEIARAAAAVMGKLLPVTRLHKKNTADISEIVRREIGSQGWYGCALDQSNSGAGLSAVDQALFFREIGRVIGPIDILSQCLASRCAASTPAADRLLSGDMSVALAVPADNNDKPNPAATQSRTFRLFGGGDAPECAIHVAHGEATVFSLDTATIETLASIDPAVSMRRASVAADDVIASVEGTLLAQLGQLATAAMLVGLAETALAGIVEYAKVRKTFGRPIGAYQAVRHPCADMALRVEAARCQLWYAAGSIKANQMDADTHLDAAKHLANVAAVLNADWNIQLHGGIGITDEHDAHLILKHSLLLSRLFGTKRTVLARLLTAPLDDGIGHLSMSVAS